MGAGGLRRLGGWSAGRVGSSKWLVAVCICPWWFLSPDIGEGSDHRFKAELLVVHPTSVPGSRFRL